MEEYLKVKIITGLSGSGKTSLLNLFEDEGYYCVDNLPPILFFDLLKLHNDTNVDLAVLMDLRLGNGFYEIADIINNLRNNNYDLELIFLEASNRTLAGRYTDTRRKHPLQKDGTVSDAIKKESFLLKDIRELADSIIDTSDMNIHNLKSYFIKNYSNQKKEFVIKIVSFGFKKGDIKNCDYVFDVRFLKNPYYIRELRDKTGYDKEVFEYIFSHKNTLEFSNILKNFIEFIIVNNDKYVNNYISIGIGCTGGKHRSVAISNDLASYIKEQGYNVIREDRELK